MPNVIERRQRITDARKRLVDILKVIANDATLSASGRCPYRGVCDACSFSFACRNQLRDVSSQPRCNGGTLNPEPIV